MAYTGNLAWYVSTVKYAAVTQWATNTAKNVGDLVRQLAAPTVGNERVFVCVVAGTTHATTEPTWTVTRGAKTTDNTVTWQEMTGVAAGNGDLTHTPTWNTVKNTAVSIGHVITSNDGQITLICDTAGTAGNGAEPSWSTTLGNTTADNTVTWRTLKISGNKFANWAAPSIRQRIITNTAGYADINGQDIYLSSDHAETEAATVTFTSRGTNASPHRWISVNSAGSVPPGASDLLKGAAITNTGSAISLTIQGALSWVYGITFTCGTSNTCEINTATAEARNKLYEQCDFRAGPGTGGNSNPIRAVSGANRVRYKDCTVKMTAAGQTLETGGWHEFDNLTLDSGGTKPTNLFTAALGGDNDNALWIFRGCDFSFFTSGTLVSLPNRRMNNYIFEDCKLASGITLVDTSNVITSDDYVSFLRCALGVAGDHDFQVYSYEGVQSVDTTVTRHGGARSIAGTDFGWKMAASAVCNNAGTAFKSSRMGLYNSTTGSSKTITVYGIANAASMPTDTQVWLDAQYLGDASDSYGTQKTTRGNLLGSGTSLTADSASDWDDHVTARQNTHAYVVGDVISLASNPGRIFFCTTAGTSAGSEPAGYASAVDGGSVTDNTAIFRAGWRFSIAVTLTSPNIAQAGNIHGFVTVGAPSLTAYFDPLMVIS